MTRILVVVTARASWAKLSPVCAALRRCVNTDLQIVVCASALLERYGSAVDVITGENYAIAERVFSVCEGSTLETGALEVGHLQAALARTYARLRPDAVVVCADRREVLAAAAAARMMEIETVHMQGGEKSGSVDDDVRDAITQLASVHCVATAQARHRVYGLTGDWTRIHQTGCPSIDLARQALSDVPVTLTELGGAGAPVALDQPFVVVLQHPTSDAVDEAGEQTIITLNALAGIDLPLVIFWPGQEPGAEAASKTIRMWQAQRPDLVIHTVRSLPPRRFLRLLTQAAVLVGNSSAGLREASYLGTPVVNIGTRQRCRERGQNVVTVPHKVLDISIAVRAQIAHGSYERSELYGDGTAGERIADILTSNRFDS